MAKKLQHLLASLLRSKYLASLLLVAGVSALFLPALAGWRGIFHDDLAKESFPRYFFIANSLQHGIIPLWDPQTWCGVIPFYALYLSDTYYLPLWISFFLTPLRNLTCSYWMLIVIPLWLHYILGASGMFVFLRRLAGTGRFASICGALAYVFSPCFTYAHVWPQAVFTLAWLPWLLVIYASAVQQPRFWKIAAAGLVFAFIITSGQVTYWHFVIFLWAITALYMVVSGWRAKNRALVKTALGVGLAVFIIGIALSSVYLFSFIDGLAHTQEHIDLSVDAVLSRQGANLPPFYLATLFIPNLFSNITGVDMLDIIPDQIYFWEANMSGGMAVSLLVTLALALFLIIPKAEDRKKRWWALVLGGVYLVSILCVLGRYTPFYKHVIGNLPGINLLPFAVRYRMLECFAAAGLIGIGLDHLIASSFVARAREHLRRWVLAYVIFSFLVVFSGMAYAYAFCRYKIINHWSEATIPAASTFLSIGEGVGRYTSAYFETKKLRIEFDAESFGEIRFADTAKEAPAGGTLAAHYYSARAGFHEFDVSIPPRKFVWIRQKSGAAGIGYQELEQSRRIFNYDAAGKRWLSGPRVSAIWLYYTKVFPGKDPPLILGEGDLLYQEKSNISREAQLKLSWKEEFRRVLKEEIGLRKRMARSGAYWLLFGAAIILGLYYLSPRKLGYFLGILALSELFIFGGQAVYDSGYGWYAGNNLPYRYAKPLDRPIIKQMLGPLEGPDKNPSLRITTLTPYFDNYVRLKGRFALKGFGMHPMETRFKQAFEKAYGQPVDWDYYNNAHKPAHLSFLNNFSVGYAVNGEAGNIFPAGQSTRVSGPLKLYLHFNPAALPRAYTLDRLIKASEKEQLDQLVSGDLRRAVYLKETGHFSFADGSLAQTPLDPGAYFSEMQRINPIRRLNLNNPNRIDIDIDVHKPAMLVLTEVWYPGWVAYIDGRKTDVLRVNYCQRGVWLEKGRHRVNFIFRPAAWRWGAGISLGTLILLSCLLAVFKIRKNNAKK